MSKHQQNEELFRIYNFVHIYNCIANVAFVFVDVENGQNRQTFVDVINLM